jgi:ABC-2 type transport system permease protein
MTVEARLAGAGPVDSVVQPPTRSARLLGLGSVYGKAFHDSRRTALILAAVFGLLVAATAYQLVAEFKTTESRLAFAGQLTALPAIFQGMLGEPVRIDTLGGFVSWRIFNFLPVMLGIWSLVVLSGTLAGELARGSLDFVAATPVARRRLAVQKVLAFVSAVLLSVVVLEGLTYASLNALGTLPSDAVPISAAAGSGAWLLTTILMPGAVAFAVAPILGRGAALGIGATVLFLSFVVSAYSDIVPAFEILRPLSYLHVTADHRPLGGQWDWPAVGVLAVVVLVLFGAGVVAFERRDLLAASAGRLRIPAIRLWVRGVFLRGVGERLPASLAWGFGLGLYGILIATSADEFVAQIGKIPQIVAMVRRIFPDANVLSTAGFLQLSFFGQGIIMFGLAAATFVGGWASDEGDRRLEVLLATPVGRVAWAMRSGASVLTAIALMTFLMAVGVAVGTAAQGDEIAGPTVGVAVLGLYGMALAGIGLAVGGLVRPSLAAPATAVLAIGFFLLDLLGAILNLPDAVTDLALNRHLGRPMLGDFDEAGIVACLVLAIGGLGLSALGIRRRDVGR